MEGISDYIDKFYVLASSAYLYGLIFVKVAEMLAVHIYDH